ncbi:hypothetical protein SDC9_183568 [bioreactor metagenome]|uniref:Uncharacterized protein n=1 Tax=bioreactor metagenome TaxID=1076179 RepID=A0A645HKA4_9ZZZZ
MITCPARYWAAVDGDADFTIDRLGSGAVVGVVVVDGAESMVLLAGSVPWDVAVFLTLPSVTSSAVIVYTESAVQTSVAPGASVVLGQLTEPTFASVTPTPVSGTSPGLETSKVYWMVSPASDRPLPLTSTGVPACLTTEISGLLKVVVVLPGGLSPLVVTLLGPLV